MHKVHVQKKIPLLDNFGVRRAEIRIVAPVSTGQVHPLIEISASEAREWGEAQIQILEGRVYEYELELASPELRIREGVFRKSSLSDQKTERGTILPQEYTGLLPIILLDANGLRIAEAALEVRSAKLDYRNDYRSMLDFITRRSTDLLLEIRAPSLARLAPDVGTDSRTVGQRFAFVRHLLASSDFQDAMARILVSPHKGHANEDRHRDIRQGFSPSGAVLRQLVSARPRVKLPSEHSLSSRLPTVPSRLLLSSSSETVDTPENRFAKYVLSFFESFLSNMAQRLHRRPRLQDAALLQDINAARSGITTLLAHELFRTVSSLTSLSLGSSVLQRRAGYRELLQAWLKFNLAARLTWDAGDDIYGGGKRNVAALYEYWLFFQMCDLVTDKFGFPRKAMQELIEKTDDGFGLKLKSGRHLSICGTFNNDVRQLNARFSYNRVFTREESKGDNEANYPNPGSWTRRMRPDYTLSIWPAAFSEDDAERQELIVHIHFDAKYRVDSLTDLFGKDTDADLDEAKQAAIQKRAAKRDDLLKMHAYRDAIRRSEGAYVLYPGDTAQQWRGYHELLPGLGAFAVRPGDNGEGIARLEEFLDGVVSQVSNRIALRERQSYHRYIIERDYPGAALTHPTPEKDEENKRLPPPSEQWVLAGWCASDTVMQSVIASKLYCVFVPSDEDFGADIADAQYVLLYVDGNKTHPSLQRIIGKGPRFLTRSQLIDRGYGDLAGSEGIYGVFSISPTTEGEYQNLRWDTVRLAALEMEKAPRLPQTLRLDVVLAACEAST